MGARATGARGATGARRATGAVRSVGAVRSAGAERSGGTERAEAARRTRSTAPNLTHPTHPAHPSRVDRLIHDRTRLAILAALAATESLAFNDLKGITGTTDGNLSVHARRLEDAGYVACDKTFAGRTPRTDYRLTAAGRRALEKYLDHMDALIKATRKR